MWESDSSTIEQLRKAYFEDLPSQMAAARHERERQALRDRQMKIRNLLLNGYGVTLARQAVCPETEAVHAVIQAPSRDRRTVLHANGKKEKLHLVRPSAVAMPEKEEPPSQEAFPPSKTFEEKKRSRRISRDEDRRAIARLRSEYDELAIRISQTGANAERGKLLERQHNIRHLLEGDIACQFDTVALVGPVRHLISSAWRAFRTGPKIHAHQTPSAQGEIRSL